MATKARVGDIIEVETKLGLSYAQYTHKHPEFGELIRVIDSVFQARPSDPRALSETETKFVTFFPLSAALRRGIFEIIGHADVPRECQKFPLFREGVADPKTKTVGNNWWLWDGTKEWRVGKLTSEQWKLPILGIWNDTLLIERIEAGWMPEGHEW